MKKIVNRIIIIISIIVVTVVTLLLFSNKIEAAEDELSDVYTYGGFARFLISYPDKWWDASIKNLFNLNVRGNKNLTGLSTAGLPIEYHSAVCMFHAQSDSYSSGELVVIQNIIEIEAPGNVKVYKFNRYKKWFFSISYRKNYNV